jgi:hypothetical protein
MHGVSLLFFRLVSKKKQHEITKDFSFVISCCFLQLHTLPDVCCLKIFRIFAQLAAFWLLLYFRD